MRGRNIPWMLAAKDLLNDLPFFGALGFICGLVQWVGYHYFNKAQWGAELLQEHIAFNSMVLTVMFLWLVKGTVERLCAKRELSRLTALVDHIVARAVALASVAAAVVMGFGLAAAFFHAFGHALMFEYFALYFVALAEIAANPLFSPGHSRTYLPALSVIIGLPLGLRFLV
ncbi:MULTISPECIES: hypothetical protein [Paraburkholderia]|uniref:hypothetical protein n=1 Tax=Paraburkholderia TaxID=1822464 RepID=UPI0038BAAECB